MDSSTYQRYLNYLERFSYFKRPGMVKLELEQWRVLDEALATVVARKSRAPADQAEEAALRQKLMRD